MNETWTKILKNKIVNMNKNIKNIIVNKNILLYNCLAKNIHGDDFYNESE